MNTYVNGMPSFGAGLRQLRKAKGFTTLKDFATALHVSAATVSRWENDEDHPSGKNLKIISATLGVPLEILLAADGVTPPTEEARPRHESSPELRSAITHIQRELIRAVANAPDRWKKIVKHFKDQATLLADLAGAHATPASKTPDASAADASRGKAAGRGKR